MSGSCMAQRHRCQGQHRRGPKLLEEQPPRQLNRPRLLRASAHEQMANESHRHRCSQNQSCAREMRLRDAELGDGAARKHPLALVMAAAVSSERGAACIGRQRARDVRAPRGGGSRALFCAALALALGGARASCGPREREALVELFGATEGAGWAESRNWNTSADVCAWFGVTCTPGASAVAKLCVLPASGGGVWPCLVDRVPRGAASCRITVLRAPSRGRSDY